MISFVSFKPDNSSPIYLQILAFVKRGIASGKIKDSDELPSRRALSVLLGINPNTVQRAYLELERKGFSYSVKGKGSFAADPDHVRLRKQELVRPELEAVVRKAVSLSMTEEDLVAETRQLYSRFSEQIRIIRKGGAE